MTIHSSTMEIVKLLEWKKLNSSAFKKDFTSRITDSRWRGVFAMEEKQLLIFRCGTEKYGVPVEDVRGIISNTGINGLSIVGKVAGTIPVQGNSSPISGVDVGLATGENKSGIITDVNGVQILIIVDEVIQEKKLMGADLESDVTVVPLQIWKFKKK